MSGKGISRDRTPPGLLSYNEIAEAMGLTNPGVRFVEKRALAKLRAALEAEGLTAYDLLGYWPTPSGSKTT